MENTDSLERRIQRLIFKPRFLTHLLFASSIFASSNTWADNDFGSMTGFPVIPGVTATGLAGPTVMGLFDAMVPLVGWPTSFFYIDPQFSIQNGDNYSGAGGAGYRWLNDQAGILGAYVFTDYLHSPNNNNFWFVSPGIERLGNTIDFSANAYIPVSDQTQSLGVYQGTEIGENQFVSFQGHNQYDALFYANESVGFGADAQIGYRLPIVYNPKVFVGGYYSDPQSDTEDNIWGGTVRVEMPVTQNIRVSLSEAYDNFYHNTFKVGLSVDLVGRHTQKTYRENDLASRMLDPVQRNLILVAGGSVTNQPIIQDAAQFADAALVRSNISFFESAGTDPNSSQEGTFENPYQGLTQGHVDDGNTKGNNTFYFNTGTYIQNSTINFTNDDIYGRQTFNGLAFALPASGNSRPVFNFSGMNTGVDTAFNVLATQDLEIKDIVMIGNNSSIGILTTVNSDNGIDLTFQDIEVDNFGVGINVTNLQNLHTLLLNEVVANANNSNGFELINQGVANNVTLQNSNLTQNNGAGVFVNNNDATLVDLSVLNTNLSQNINGFALVNTNALISGNIQINNSAMNNNSDNGVNIQNTANASMADIVITQSNINNNVREGVLVENTTSTLGTINLSNSIINQNGLAGINITNLDGKIAGVLVDGSNVSMNGLNGLVILNQGGTIKNITLNNDTIDNNTSDGVSIQNAANGQINNINVTGYTSVSNNIGNGLIVNNGPGKLGSININNANLTSNISNGVSVINNNGGVIGNVSVLNNSTLNQNGAAGFNIQNSGTVNSLYFNDSTFNNNGTISSLGGIFLENNGGLIANGITLSNIKINANTGNGLSIDNTLSGNANNINLINSTTMSNNSLNGLLVTNTDATIGNITLDNIVLNNNTLAGFNVLNDMGSSINNIGLSNATNLNNNGTAGLEIQNIGTLTSVSVDNSNINNNGTGITPLSGFAFSNVGGTVTNDITINNSIVNNNTGGGINITNSVNGHMNNVNIIGNTTINFNIGDGLQITNDTSTLGNINIVYSTLDNNLGSGLSIFNFNSSAVMGNINLDHTNIQESGGNGIFIDNFRGTLAGISLDSSNILSNGLTGLTFANVGGTVTGDVVFNDTSVNNNNGNALLIANSVAGHIQNITVVGGTVDNNAGMGLYIRNNGNGHINNITATNAQMNNNTGSGFNLENVSAASVINSVTLDAITSTSNGGIDVLVNNTTGTITTPSPGNIVSDPASTIGSKNCINCTFVP